MAYLNFPGKQPGPGTELVERVNWSQDGLSGFGCADCGGTCGLGLFDGSPSEWGMAEYAVLGLGAYALLSMVFTTKRAASRVAAIPGNRRKSKAAQLRKRADELTRSSKKK